MKLPSLKKEVDDLKASRQYFSAAWRLIDKTIFRDEPEVRHDLKTEVGAILKEAMGPKIGAWAEANKIVRHFERYLHGIDYDEAQLELNGITIPDEVIELDERALLL